MKKTYTKDGSMAKPPIIATDTIRECWNTEQFAVEVGLILTPTTGVNQTFFNEFGADSFEEALDKLFFKSWNFPLIYRVTLRGVEYAPNWYAEWALMRRASVGGISEREMRNGAAPWDYYPDDTVLEIWRTTRGIIRMRTAGETPEAAEKNWLMAARAIKQHVRAAKKKQ